MNGTAYEWFASGIICTLKSLNREACSRCVASRQPVVRLEGLSKRLRTPQLGSTPPHPVPPTWYLPSHWAGVEAFFSFLPLTAVSHVSPLAPYSALIGGRNVKGEREGSNTPDRRVAGVNRGVRK